MNPYVMEHNEKHFKNFNIIYSEKRRDSNTNTATAFSSCSSNSSNSSFLGTHLQNIQNIKRSTPIPLIDQNYSAIFSKRQGNSNEHINENETQKEESSNLRVTARSKCGRFLKYNTKIGEGGYKIVNKGFDKETSQFIAWCEVKVDNKEKIHSTFKEIEIMLKLNHPNVVSCFAVLQEWYLIRDDSDERGQEGRGLVIIQEYMGSGTLKEMIKKNFKDGHSLLDIQLITRWLYQILDVLRYMHCRIQPPIIHRDVKSENCFLVEQTDKDFINIKLGDFGLATTINQNSQRKSMIGTVGFMAPEVFEEKYDNKVDIYAFGMMVLEVMTNKTPYDDCKNVFQVISRTMGADVSALISTVKEPLIKEIIMACVHPQPNYRPSAEELCEHQIFQNSMMIIEPIYYGGNKSKAISDLVQQLPYENKPIINLIIRTNRNFLLEEFDFTVTFALDVYLAYQNDLFLLMEVLKSNIESQCCKSFKKTNQLKKILDNIRLQVHYLVKLVNGERWRRIFEQFIIEEKNEIRSQRSNSTPNHRTVIPDVSLGAPFSSLNLESDTKYTNNFLEYSHTVAVYHKTTEFLESEIENYCRDANEKKSQYFFNLCIQHKEPHHGLIQPYYFHCQDYKSTSAVTGSIESIINSHSSIQNHDKVQLAKSPKMRIPSSNDEVFASSFSKQYLKAELFSSADFEIEGHNRIPDENYLSICSPHQHYRDNSWNWDEYPNAELESPETLNFLYHNDNFSSQSIHEKKHFLQNLKNEDFNSFTKYEVSNRRLSEPAEVYSSNSPIKLNQIYRKGKDSPSDINFAISKASSLNSYSSQINFNSDQSTNRSVRPTYYPSGIQFNNSLYLQNRPQPHLTNHHQSSLISGPPHIILQPHNPYLSPNISGIYYKSQFADQESKFMQSYAPYLIPSDQIARNPISVSQPPVLTRSLPSIVGSVPAPLDNIIVSEIHQAYVTSSTNATGPMTRTPMSIGGASGDGNLSLRQGTVSNYSQNQPMSQKFSPSVISTSRPLAVRPQSSYSTVIPSTKVLDKPKKKNKSRSKCKYLLKVINIQESTNPGETILTFEMTLPMHQMRFTCCLSNEINTLDVSKSVGESGQIPGELRKKDILESLVNTLKKICHHLSEDINSISLNEEYVFHPFLPNSGLLKYSDYLSSIPTSFDSDINQLSIPSNTNLSIQSHNSCTSSRSLSRHPSTEDVSLSIGNLSMTLSEQPLNNVADNDLILFCENESVLLNAETQKHVIKPACEYESKSNTIVSNTKCTCPGSDSSLKVPEYIFSTVKQIVDKILSFNCKGLIILPQSNDLLTRNFRVLEIPADHMFVGLPCSDSSYNVIKGQKDKDFIIAKDTRDPENVTEKCVYQKPSDGAVLLDSSGEIQYIQKPSLIIPSKPGHGNEKTEIKELPSELTHNKDISLDCDQIVSVLQSLVQIQSNAYQSKDELFDSPVLLEPVRDMIPKQPNVAGGSEGPESYVRRGSDESIVTQAQGQSQIQVERIFCQYVALPRAADVRHDDNLTVLDNLDRDLPRQQVRSRKISSESIDSISAIRTRVTSTVSYGNEADNIQASQAGFPKVLPGNQGNLQNAHKAVPVGTLINPMPVQRLSNVAVPASAQYLLTNQNPTVNSMSGNIFLQNIQSVPLYNNSAPGSAVNVAKSQSTASVPLVLPNHNNSMGLNFPHILSSQVVMPPGMSQAQLSQLHQIQQNSSQRMPVPSSMATASLPSSQLMSLIPGSQQGTPAPIHASQVPSFTEQHLMQPGSHLGDLAEQTFPGLSRQIPLADVRQLPPPGSSPYYDPSVINSVLADNLRMHLISHTLNAQSQTHPLLLVPHTSLAAPSVGQTTSAVSMVAGPSSSINIMDPVQGPEADCKPKPEQTIGRFVIRPVVDSTEKS